MTKSPRHLLLVSLVAGACRAAPPSAAAPGAPAPAPIPGVAPGPGPSLVGGGAAIDSTCGVIAGVPGKRDTVDVALADSIDPADAPVPRNEAERVVFSQLYETLVRLDCAGRMLPGLAQSWETGDRWTFRLREDARFWDGAPVTARDVAAAWRARDSSLAQSVTVLGERELSVRAPAVPVQPFADPALAVTKRAPGGDWPIGTGDHWVSQIDAAGILWALPLRRARLPVLRVETVPAVRMRDALDRGADLMITSDPTVLEYADSRSGYVDAPLDWSRTYALLVPGGGQGDGGLRDVHVESLRDAVHLDARPAAGGSDSWFADLKSCSLPARDAAPAAGQRQRVVYDQADRNAADLAARIVGLGALGTRGVASGLAPAAFAAALRSGGDAAYVLSIRRHVFDVCRAALELPAWSWTGTIVPLLDVRPHAVVRRGLPPLTVDWGGTPRFTHR